MFNYFTTRIINDVQVVNGMNDGGIGLPIPEEYLGIDILGYVYSPTENKFYTVE